MKKFIKSIPLNYVPWLILFCAALSVIGTYGLLTHTYDEPAHVAAGLEWWIKGQYTLEPMHPPFARIMTAILPLLAFGKSTLSEAMGAGNYVFGAGRGVFKSPDIDYWKLIFLSRLGVLPFYIASCIALFFWSRRVGGLQTACWSLALYATLPVVAGNAGLATTDMAAASMVFIALYVSMRWLEASSTPPRAGISGIATICVLRHRSPLGGGDDGIKWAAFAGIFIGLMICCKFSTLLQFPAAFLPMVALWLYHNKFLGITKQHWLTGFFIIIPLMAFVVMALHLFHYETIIQGLEAVMSKNAHGHAIWLLGPLNNHGVWYYFPVLFFTKTPFPFLIAILAAFAYVRTCPLAARYPLVAALGVFVACAFSDINIGLRHVLVIYPLFAIAAGVMMQRWWQMGLKKLCWFLVGWQCVSYAAAYPNLFAYFNLLAGSKPEIVSTGPDLDWGQDVGYVEKAIKAYNIDHLTLCNFFTRDSLALSLLSAPIDKCVSNEKDAKGWFVISRSKRVLDENFAWLDKYTPVEEIGASYVLYYFK